MFTYPDEIENLSDISKLDAQVERIAGTSINDIYFDNFVNAYRNTLKGR